MPRVSTTLSLSELQNMIEGKRKELKKLTKRRAKQLKHLNKIEARIALISGNGTLARVPGRRHQNETNLADALHHVLSKSSQPLGIREIAEQVEASGYKSSSANFPGLVNLTLIKDKRFERAGRGVYGLREVELKAPMPAAAGRKSRKARKAKAVAK